jgi:SAM-dependent methyltransferase
VNRETVEALDAINRDFYTAHAEEFLATRAAPWPGWSRLLPHLRAIQPRTVPLRILDVGCGNGRLGAWLDENLEQSHRYTGLDRSLALLALAPPGRPRLAPGRFLADIVRSGGRLPCRTATAEAVLALAFLHHVPSLELRRSLIGDLLRVLRPGGILALSFWQFAAEERFQRRMVPWRDLDSRSELTVQTSELEDGDHLLAWGEHGASSASIRYCHYTSAEEADRLLDDRPAELVESYHADGRSGRLNLYRVWRRS